MKPAPQRCPQIDSLRAIAVAIVLLHHFLDTPFFLSGFGAVLFFFLSGYFATNSLLRLRGDIDSGRLERRGAFETFYLRRYLRILPVYYLVLLITAFVGVADARSTLFWNAGFLSNFQMLINGQWNGRFSPLWSLAVLEQFYLFWPFALLTVPRRYLPHLIAAAIAAAPLYRLICLGLNLSPMFWCLVPFSAFDQLGCGALLACCISSRGARATQAHRVTLLLGKACALLFAAILIFRSLRGLPPYYAIYIPLVASLSFIWLVDGARRGFSGIAGRILEAPFLSRIGKMSYSIFLLHNFAALLIPQVGWLRPILATDLRVFLLVPATLLMAQFSWSFIESPILNFRRNLMQRLPAIDPAPSAQPSPGI